MGSDSRSSLRPSRVMYGGGGQNAPGVFSVFTAFRFRSDDMMVVVVAAVGLVDYSAMIGGKPVEDAIYLAQ